MAIDTSRDRLERLYFAAGGRRLWRRTWATFVDRESHRASTRSRPKGQSLIRALATIAVVGVFGLHPAIGSLDQLGGRFGFAWSDPSTCDGLRNRYEAARDSIGAPKADGARSEFLGARDSCRRFSSSLTSPTRSVSCDAAIRTYLRAFQRSEKRHAAAPPAPAGEDATGFLGASRLRRVRANEVFDTDDIQAGERMAASYFEACVG